MPLSSGSFGASCSVGKVHLLFLLTLPLCIIGSFTFINTVTAQQVTSDGTVSTTVTTPDGKNFNIDDGTRRGGNLFHSFKEFSVPNGGSANFNNATDVQNIIGRVTGGSVSDINGLIQAQGKANLFLLNPAGIMFGPNARLQIGGSFLGSTANSFVFDNGFEFSATNPQAPPLLTINIPIGLRYRDNPGNITNQSAALKVDPNKTLALVGGNVQLDGARLLTPESRVELGGVSGAGTVGLEVNNNALRLSFADNAVRADVSLTKGAEVNVRGGSGGSIAVNAQNFKMTQVSKLRAGIASGQGSPDSKAGDIDIDATGAITLSDGSFIANAVLGVGKGGDTNIKTGSLFLTDGGQVSTSSAGKGNAGNVTIQARDEVSANGVGNGFSSGVFNSVNPGAVGNSGAINITAGSLSLTGGAQINASTSGQGNSGEVNIDVRDAVNMAGEKNGFFPEIVTAVFQGGKGNGGNISIKARSLSLTDYAVIDPMVYGEGNAGSAFIETKDFVSLSNTGRIYSSVSFPPAKGNGGDINIKTGTLSLTDGSFLSVNTFSEGNTGRVFVEARDAVYISNASIESNVGNYNDSGNTNVRIDSNVGNVYKAVGDSRDIDITTGSLVLTNGGQLTANTYGQGNAGNVRITAKDIVFDGQDSQGNRSGVYSTLQPGGIGDSGNIKITSRSLSITNGARLSASSEGNGTAGNLEVSADSIRLNNQAAISADTTAGLGNINLRSGDLVLRRGSNITTDATGTATGGNITIDTNVLAALENSDIRANAQGGSGGKITIKTQGLFGLVLRTQTDMQRLRPDDLDPNQLPTSDITAISQNNPDLSGTVNINIPDVDPTRGLFELSETVIDPAQQIAQNPCLRGGGEFIITGRGGFPTDPNKVLSGDNVRVDLVKPVASKVSSTSTTQKQSSTSATAKEIVPAQGWIFNEKGEVVLVAYDPTKTGIQREQPTPASSCAALR
nr:filamentous hemagglutinin N-terminal domain-containing protein [Brasilonema sp. UFV-L1]